MIDQPIPKSNPNRDTSPLFASEFFGSSLPAAIACFGVRSPFPPPASYVHPSPALDCLLLA